MTTTATEPRWTLERLPLTARAPSTRALVREGLSLSQKQLPPMLFYDAKGSALFEQICALPEYYVTRTERALLERHRKRIADGLDPHLTVAELGSGSSEKTVLVLEALLAGRARLPYLPVDISEAALREAAERLTATLPGLEVHALVAEYRDGVRRLAELFGGQHLTLFLGSNLGNFDPDDARSFLADIRKPMRQGDLLLMGVDLVKDPAVLERAYDDAQGVTAAFNLNMLEHLNRSLGADFDLDGFAHRACWNEAHSRIEMQLVSRRAQTVFVRDLDERFEFAAGEHIHTESSYKYTPERLDALAQSAGWSLVERFIDDDRLISLNLLAPDLED